MKNSFHLDSNTLYYFLKKCNNSFKPKLSDIVNLQEYAEKLSKNSVQFCYYIENILVGMLAMYANDYKEKTAVITSISVLKQFWRRGIATQLLTDAIEYADYLGFKTIKLKVYNFNINAINLYKKFDFKKEIDKKDSFIITLEIESFLKTK